ncbi:MAG TPA: hypothetical protein VFC09_06080 [Candidatus Dormibacteraeota bacterium]|nr:hypothetical protein [Candidatus Dormibacteraeota bacterium]
MPARKAAYHWRFVCSTPVREVFAVTEQMVGTPPYRFEPAGPDRARIVEAERKHFLFGQFSKKVRRPRWIDVAARETEAGTEVEVSATRGKAPRSRALQVVQLLTRGVRDRRTVYRDRSIPDGPITLVASWAGMEYAIYLEPRYDAPRGERVHTASPISAIGMHGTTWVKVRLASGAEGYIERDQVVPAPSESSRAAQVRTATFG